MKIVNSFKKLFCGAGVLLGSRRFDWSTTPVPFFSIVTQRKRKMEYEEWDRKSNIQTIWLFYILGSLYLKYP